MDFKMLIPFLLTSMGSGLAVLTAVQKLSYRRLERMQKLAETIASVKAAGLDDAHIAQLREKMAALADAETGSGHNAENVLDFVVVALGTVGSGGGFGTLVWAYMNGMHDSVPSAWGIFLIGLVLLGCSWLMVTHPGWLYADSAVDAEQPADDAAMDATSDDSSVDETQEPPTPTDDALVPRARG